MLLFAGAVLQPNSPSNPPPAVTGGWVRQLVTKTPRVKGLRRMLQGSAGFATLC